MARLLRAYTATLQRHPLLVHSLQAGTLMSVGDASSQLMIERCTLQSFEWARPARFFMLGTFMAGPLTSSWYGFLRSRYASRTLTNVLKKLALDQLVFGPTFLVLLIGFTGVMKGLDGPQVKQRIKRDIKDVVIAGWMVWPGVQLCNFTLVPGQYQVLVVQVTAFFWNTYLAWKVNRNREA